MLSAHVNYYDYTHTPVVNSHLCKNFFSIYFLSSAVYSFGIGSPQKQSENGLPVNAGSTRYITCHNVLTTCSRNIVFSLFVPHIIGHLRFTCKHATSHIRSVGQMEAKAHSLLVEHEVYFKRHPILH